jgi:N-ethylmaleimide reductase
MNYPSLFSPERRLQLGFPLTPYNRATFYGGEEIGYTDYPVHDELEQA